MGTNHVTEQRIALVLNGGVSLAVWMAGVVYEIDLLRRSSQAAPNGQPPCILADPDAAVMRSWRRLCSAGTGQARRVVVDVIAGTSAGGLNGTLLATAIARGNTLNPTRDNRPWLSRMWIEQAALTARKLLSKGTGPASLLSGPYFSETIEKALEGLADCDSGTPVSLFVTATAVDPSNQTYVDGYGGEFTVPDHRRIYRFERSKERLAYHAPEEWNAAEAGACFSEVETDHFCERQSRTLGLAARGSASFPVAFPAVQENLELNGTHRIVPQEPAGRSWLIDGGILDNAPFGPVLDAIARRPLTGDTRRTLVYVVPSNGRDAPGADIAADGPSWQQIAVAGVSFPREVDFRADIEQLETLMREGEAVWADADQLFTRLLASPAQRDQHVSAATNLVSTYRTARAAGGIREARLIAKTRQSTSEVPSAPTSLSAHPTLSADDVAAVLGTSPGWLPPENAALTDFTVGSPWQWGFSTAHNSVRLMLQHLRNQLAGTPGDERLTTAITEVDRSLRRIVAVREAFEKLIIGLDSEVADDDTLLAQHVSGAMAGIHTSEVLSTLVGDAVEAFTAVPGLVTGPGPRQQALLRTLLAVEVIGKALHARLPQQRHAAFDLLRLGPDTQAPALEGAYSAMAVALGGGKLYGTQAGHFGAFGRVKWRRWDWMWGRLDAAAQLGRAIGSDQGMTEAQIESWIANMQHRILRSEGRSARQVEAGLTRVAQLNLPNVLNAMRSRSSRDSLRLLGDRALRLLTNGHSGGLATVALWLACLTQRHDMTNLSTYQRVARWFTHPLRAAAWYWLAQAEVPEPATPWLLRRWLYWVGFTVLLASAALLGWQFRDRPVAMGLLTLAAVLLGLVSGALVLLAWLGRRRRKLGGFLPGG
ncbi:DUF3376 domain-containing protein [Amycolatopsis sp. NEAU-NG30]|uniref:DUF3376 domain-containing protein n=1 Tax=Amycolatopsis melonis TaxID=3156488 RepID=A0ABV0LBG3_9PSEU